MGQREAPAELEGLEPGTNEPGKEGWGLREWAVGAAELGEIVLGVTHG